MALSQENTRPARFALVIVSAPTASPASPPATAKIRSGTPATNSAPATRMTMTSAVPRSCPISTRPIMIAETGRTGINACFQSCRSGRLRASTVANQIASASLTTSDGCAEYPPSRIQFRCPCTEMPTPGTNTASWNSADAPRKTHANRVNTCTGTRAATTSTGTPMSANCAWLANSA